MYDRLSLLTKLSNLMRYPNSEHDFLLKTCELKFQRHPMDPESRFKRYCQQMLRLSLSEREELFTTTFDLKPKSFPYAGYHLYGEDYKRGLLMAGLKGGYRECGMEIDDELPDFVPLLIILYLRLEDADKAMSLRDDLLIPGMTTIHKELQEASSPYADIYQIVLNFLDADKASTSQKKTVLAEGGLK